MTSWCFATRKILSNSLSSITGAVGALSLTAACAPDDKFLKWGGPLSLCLGGVFVAAIGGMFVPASSAAAPVLHSVVT